MIQLDVPKKPKKLFQNFWTSLFVVITILVLFLSIRGKSGVPLENDLNSPKWLENGPFELSPERGRYALTYSLVENKSVFFTLPVARFTTPDLGYFNDRFVSLFAPGVSFLLVPGYILGKSYGLAQVGTYLVVAIFAFFNAVLIKKIASRLGAGEVASILGAITFLFATPAFAYSVSLYQHHISTFLILSSLYLLLRWKSNWVLVAVWFLIASAIPIDYPNLFLLFPVGLFALGRAFSLRENKRQFTFIVKPVAILGLVGVVIPIIFFFWFNKESYGNPLQFSGTIEAIESVDDQGNPSHHEIIDEENGTVQIADPKQQKKKTAISFFNTRNLLNGFYTHLISLDRGMAVYTPVLLVAIVGWWLLYKKNKSFSLVLLSVFGINILLYSMWGDPYGGWAFGSRYMIPSYALGGILIAFALDHWRRKPLFIMIYLILALYSLGVNTLGALTTNRIPPQIQVLSLEEKSGIEEKYTYERSYDMLMSNQSKSFVFQTYMSSLINAQQYYWLVISPLSGLIILGSISLLEVKTIKFKLKKFLRKKS